MISIGKEKVYEMNKTLQKSIKTKNHYNAFENREFHGLNKTKRTTARNLVELVKMSVFKRIGESKRELEYVLVLGQIDPKASQKMSQKGDENA